MKIRLLVTAIVFSFISFPIFAANSNENNMLLAKSPPGLQKKGINTTPSFLGKTPPGWDEGVKKGWNKSKDWRWDKNTNFWENKNWKWNKETNNWEKTKGWN